MATLVPPLFVTVIVAEWLDPTATLPKASLVALRASWPLVDTLVVPVPDRARLVTESVAVLEIETEALKVPAAFGLKTILTGTLCPAAIVTGKLGAVSAKYFVEIAMLLMVTAGEPEFVAVVDIVLLLPALTLPKAKDGFAREIVPLWV
jgi:hypothetical protein